MQTDTSPLKIERDALGAAYYWIDNNALDLARIDYSDLYETYMTPIEGQLFEDCTQLFIEGKLRLESTFLKTYRYWVVTPMMLLSMGYLAMISSG